MIKVPEARPSKGQVRLTLRDWLSGGHSAVSIRPILGLCGQRPHIWETSYRHGLLVQSRRALEQTLKKEGQL